jgi:hypothetical protein
VILNASRIFIQQCGRDILCVQKVRCLFFCIVITFFDSLVWFFKKTGKNIMKACCIFTLIILLAIKTVVDRLRDKLKLLTQQYEKRDQHLNHQV